MPRIHFLNVKEGDCSIIEHYSGHVTVIDVSNASLTESPFEALNAVLAKSERGVSGNFQQKKYPVNPINYMRDRNLSDIFRYIQTHPDMDHMDGIEDLFAKYKPTNFWDTDNKKEIDSTGWGNSGYKESDWKFYKRLRDSNPTSDPKRLALLSGAEGKYFNVNEDDSTGGDGLFILAPTKNLVDLANEADSEYNRCSYVILYITDGKKILFGGDSHDETWEHILENFEDYVTDIDVLIAPHHGRKSGRSYEFLNVLNPTLTFFGNARSEHLAYDAWRRRGLSIVTNNQANCMIVNTLTNPMGLYVTHENFAKKVNVYSFYDPTLQAWYVGPITENLIP